MSYIFLDESGDLGFDFKKDKTSKYFLVTCLFIPSEKGPIEKAVKKTHAELSKKLKRKFGALHAFKERPVTVQRLLKRISEKDCYCMVIYLNKSKVYTRLQDEKHVLYNYVTNILLDRIHRKNDFPKDGVRLFVSRRETNKFLNTNFENYIQGNLQNNHGVSIDLTIASPSKEKGLQAVDFLSWAIFRKYEHGDESYYNLIKSIIIEESPLFP